jgi:tripartite-type tricarboxylate transporter receptor subunit TctC
MLSRFAAVLLAAFLSFTQTVSAQDYPNKAIRLVVGFPAGGPTDVLARIIADRLSQRLGQPMVVENRPGAGSQIGVDFVAKSKPDGYTLVFGSTDGLSIRQAVKHDLPYRLPDDFSFIGSIGKSTIVIAISVNLPFQTMADLITYGKANPGKLRYGTIGVASGAHLSMEMIANAAGIKLVHVPQNGTAGVTQSLGGGFIDIGLAGGLNMKAQLDAGKIRILATVDKKRHRLFPDVPTLEEAGVLNVNPQFDIGILGPAGIPEAIQARLRREVEDIYNDPQIAERIRNIGLEPVYRGGDDFKNYLVEDYKRWSEVAKAANIVINE